MNKYVSRKMIQLQIPAVGLTVAIPVENDVVHDIPSLDAMMWRVKEAQRVFATYSQEQLDRIFDAVALAANAHRLDLAKLAVAETGMGRVEDKVIKNNYAAEMVHNKWRNTPTIGVISRDEAAGTMQIAQPKGVIAAVIPTTNPTSTAIYKILLALKTGNGIVISPHPRAAKSTIETAKILLEAAVNAGAPRDIIGWIDQPSTDLSSALMKHKGVNLILATGGPGMVSAAYSSGNPALGVGAGNTPVLVEKTADLRQAASDIILSKAFDNGVICASEQSVVVEQDVYNAFKAEIQRQGAYILNAEEAEHVKSVMLKNGKLNADIVGQSALKIADMAGITVPKGTKVLVAEVEKIGEAEPFSQEKLSPILALYKTDSVEQGMQMTAEIEKFGGRGHTSVLHTNPQNTALIETFGLTMGTGRTLVNMPASHGAIGDLYNFGLNPALTLGAGSKGHNSFMGNVGPMQLVDVKTVAVREENMLWVRLPETYFKPGSLAPALNHLAGKQRAVIVTDAFLNSSGMATQVADILRRLGITSVVFDDVNPNPDLDTVNAGTKVMNRFKPDVIIALGGGSPIDAAKLMWTMYDHPEADFRLMAMRFLDIEKRAYRFPEGHKTTFVAIPTTSGTGSEVTPFAVVTDNSTHTKYPIADYSLTPDIAIVDSNLVLNMPRGLTSATGIDVLTHAIESFVSIVRTDYTSDHSINAIKKVFAWLPEAYEKGAQSPKAREEMHAASTIAGMAFANSFLGINHSLAHALGSVFDIPHGVANALVMAQVIRYNATDNPYMMGAFSQYKYPQALARYAEIADSLGIQGATNDEKVDNFIKAIEKLKSQVNIPASIQAWGVKAEDFEAKLDKLADMAFDDQCTGANPRYPLIEEIKQLYRDAFYGIIRDADGNIIANASEQHPQ